MNRREAVAGLVGLVTSGSLPKVSEPERRWRTLGYWERPGDTETPLSDSHYDELLAEQKAWCGERRHVTAVTMWPRARMHVTVTEYADGSAMRVELCDWYGIDGDWDRPSMLVQVSDPPLHSTGRLPMI